MVVLSIILITGCSKNSTLTNPNGIYIDPNVFFSITFNGKTLTYYGLTNNTPSINGSLKLYGYCSFEIGNDGRGNVTHNFVAFGNSTQAYVKNQITFLVITDVKLGNDPTGLYNSGLIQFTDNSLSIPRTYLSIGGGDFTDKVKFNITSVTNDFVTGTFQGLMLDVDGVTTFQATGSFRLHKS